ncbi:prepilin-type N-terminal cleavage/methylation domain-containing protein [Patescibacteria group bacterium]|nr:prepilin-type N-terminal cleavage/methylation domain-containing protein [Patescibacteria group bacterium]MBU4601008.1 prepilin-type N-terminal cleavage/methylation domain-containing protein [Patescibacteria group bacterium]MCG2697687.1 prepilin-type N-terminal cleavage/methylation domain-containing protein [Candidatus Parcubacteria bacterium]
MFKKLKNNAGFTIIELLASTFIVALISGIFLANYRAGDRQASLAGAAQKMASDIRLVQNYALGLREFQGVFPAGGWGVHFEAGNSGYIIFADNDIAEYDYDAGEEYAAVSLPDNVTIDSIDVGAFLDIVFLPPDPVTYMNSASNISAQIILKDNQTGSTKTIQVNFLGLVDVVN